MWRNYQKSRCLPLNNEAFFFAPVQHVDAPHASQGVYAKVVCIKKVRTVENGSVRPRFLFLEEHEQVMPPLRIP